MKQQSSTGKYSLPYTVRVGWMAFVIPLAFGVLISLALLPIIGRGPTAVLPVILLICMVWVCIGALLLGISVQKMVLLPDRLYYHTLFSRREVRFADIVRVTLERVAGSGYRSSKVIRYFLHIDNRSSDKPLLINTKPFSKKDLSIVVDVLATHAPSADLDTSLLQLREDAF